MTRKEEIEVAWLNKAVQSNHRYDEKTFKEAVEWADKTMIDKAILWLTTQGIMYVMFESDLQDLIHDFTKAMED